MDTELETLRLALAPEATDEARASGAATCRAILATLDPSAQTPPPQRPAIDASQIAALVGALRGVPPDQLLDLAISKLRSALPVDASSTAPKGISFHIVPVAPARGGR